MPSTEFDRERARCLGVARDDAWARYEETGVLSLGPLNPGVILVGASVPRGTTTTVVGMACPTERIHSSGDRRERILPGAFKAFLSTAPPISAYLNYQHTQLLGSTSGGTLRVWECSAGLAFRLALSHDTESAHTALTALQARHRLGVSIKFRLRGTERESRNGVDTYSRRPSRNCRC